MMTRGCAAAAARLAALAVCCAGLGVVRPHAQPAAGPESGVTFAKDVARIFESKCQSCHRPGSMAPMSLVTYEDTRPWARAIRAKVAAREMPPWFIDRSIGIQRFKNDRSLTDAEISTIVKWVDAGAPLGDRRDLPPPVAWPSDADWLLTATLGKPDLVVRSPAFAVPARGPDQWWQPVIDLGLKEDRWLRAIEVKPSPKGRRVVHHASTFLYQPEDAAVREAERKLLVGTGTVEALLDAMRHPSGKVVEAVASRVPQFSEWAVGKPGDIFRENTGKLMRAGAKLGFEIHYHAAGEAVSDSTEVGLWFYPKGVVPTYAVRSFAMAAVQELDIPPNSVVVRHGYYRLPAPAVLTNFQPHMHLRGKSFRTEAIYPDGRREVLNSVPKWVFNWHVSYIYDDAAAPLMPRGTVIHNTIWYDNTAANRDNPDPRQWVADGERAVDEMGHANANIVFITEAEYQRLAKLRGLKSDTGGRSQ